MLGRQKASLGPPGTPSKGAVRGWRDKLRLRWLCSPSPSGLGGKVPRCPFDWGSPRVWIPPGIPPGTLGWHGAGRGHGAGAEGLGKRLGGEQTGPCPMPRSCPLRASVLLSRVPLSTSEHPPGPAMASRRAAGSASGGRFPPRRRFCSDCGAGALPSSRRSNYRGRARRQTRSEIAPTPRVKFLAN